MGRFLSVDPSGRQDRLRPQSWNRYAYARGNPLALLDPDGRDERDFRILHVRVNLIYSNADTAINHQGRTLRQVTEAGLVHSRNVFNQAGM